MLQDSAPLQDSQRQPADESPQPASTQLAGVMQLVDPIHFVDPERPAKMGWPASSVALVGLPEPAGLQEFAVSPEFAGSAEAAGLPVSVDLPESVDSAVPAVSAEDLPEVAG
ncbi:hypothetical protein [Neorhodopirellula lusitana]|uniref:hypothetical protein n=1 Tax=Neorhodopirellula lusitana TaxID=445327 RepID=UPI00384C6B26